MKHPELSGPLPQFGTTFIKADGGKNPRFAPVKNNVKGHGGETPQSAPVTKPHDPFMAKFHPRH